MNNMKSLTIEITKENDMHYVYANGEFKYAKTDKAEALEVAAQLEKEFLNPEPPEVIFSKTVTKPE